MSIELKHLSFTRLTKLADCPRALAEYIQGAQERTAAMDEGNLLDCLLFEPEKIAERFHVVEKADRRTKAGKEAHEAALAEAGDKILINSEQYDAARFIELCVRLSPTVVEHGLLNPELFNFQTETGFFYRGFWHKGRKDAEGVRRDGVKCIWDLKRMGATRGEKDVARKIRQMKYDLQAAIYAYEYDERGEHLEYYVIAVDNDGYVTPFRISKDARMQARYEWNKLIRAAHRVVMEGFDAGPEFWANGDGFFEF